MGRITKIKLHNFKRFQSLPLSLNENLNVFIGDNESGKSTILDAINVALSGKRKKIKTLDLEALFNYDTIKNYLNSERKYEELPILFVELYFDEQNNPELNGKNNSDNIECDGIRFECRPNDELSKEIKEILLNPNLIFPFEYYVINYFTFSGDGYSGYKNFLKHISIDHSQIGNEYALREYIKSMYNNSIEENEKPKHFNEYRKYKNNYSNEILFDLNSRNDNYSFAIRNNSKSNLETDLTIIDNEIDIENKGKGRQCFIKTDFALSRSGDNIDVILIEEPENHLSHINVNKMVKKIIESRNTQLFISTHSNMISARLDLRNAILLNSSSLNTTTLTSIGESTSKYFMKAPYNNILNFILSKKVVLVEGDAEFILMEQLYKNVTNAELSSNDIHIISVGGTSFKRYLEIAKTLGIKTAVIRDNDKDYEKKCVQDFEDYVCDYIKIFYVSDNNKYTFEVCMMYPKNWTII
jgi:predicted ATP-dependent endonuclease of OLD family